VNLADITPLILTLNEGCNLRRTLKGLSWAKQIVVVDSYSTDDTLAIASGFEAVTVHQREFDHFADQCNFGLSQVTSVWTLSLDADYICPPQLPDELRSLEPTAMGYRAGFRYCVYGTPLRGTLYPPRVVLYQTKAASYDRDGHAHRVRIDGSVAELKTRLCHDDRKPLSRWTTSQYAYARQEADKLLARNTNLGWKDRFRKTVILAPPLTLIYCLLRKLLVLDGLSGLHYTFQRVFAETLLSLELLDRRLRRRSIGADGSDSGDSTETRSGK